MHKGTKKKRSVKKTLLFVFIGIILLLIAANFVVNAVIQKKVRQKLQAMAPVARINVGSIHSDFLSSSLTLNDCSVEYTPDSQGEKHSHSLYIPRLQLKGINYSGILSGREITINSVVLEKANISLDKFLIDKREKDSADHSRELPAQKISINHLEISASSFEIHTGKTKQLSLEGEIVLDKLVADSSADYPDFRSIHCTLYKCNFLPPDLHHAVHIEKLHIDSDEKENVKAESVKIIPLYGKVEYAQKIGYQVDRVEATIPEITVEKADIQKMLRNEISADKIHVRGVTMKIFRDRRQPRNMDPKPMPVVFLQSSPQKFNVKEFSLGPSHIEYEEFPNDGTETGTLIVEKVQVVMKPMLNHPGKSGPDHLEIVTKGSLMGSGSLEATMIMPFDRQQPYRVDGAFHNVDLTTLNRSAENLGKIRIESGFLDFLSFHFVMTEEKSTGQIIGEYHNLVIDKLKEHTKDGEKKVDKLKSFALKSLIIPKTKDKSLDVSHRTGKVDYKRDPSRFYSYYLLQSLLTGIKASFTLGFLLPK